MSSFVTSDRTISWVFGLSQLSKSLHRTLWENVNWLTSSYFVISTNKSQYIGKNLGDRISQMNIWITMSNPEPSENRALEQLNYSIVRWFHTYHGLTTHRKLHKLSKLFTRLEKFRVLDAVRAVTILWSKTMESFFKSRGRPSIARWALDQTIINAKRSSVLELCIEHHQSFSHFNLSYLANPIP